MLSWVKRIWNYLPLSMQFMLKTYCVSLIFFNFFRVLFIIIGWKSVGNAGVLDVLSAFKNGFTYDTSTIGYLMIIPFLYSLFIELFSLRASIFRSIYKWLIVLSFAGAFFVCAVDIPYFLYFNTRLTTIVFQWFSTPKIVLGFVWQSYEYWIYGLLFFVLIIGFYFVINKFIKHWNKKEIEKNYPKLYRLKYGLLFLLLAVFQFAGIRGKVFTRRPLNWGEAFTTESTLLNYAGLNPVFTIGKDIFAQEKENPADLVIMDVKEAVNNSRKYYGLEDFSSFAQNMQYKDYPLARKCTFDKEKKFNVVVVLMESMSLGYINRGGLFSPSLTPFIDSISKQSIYFSNIFADGIHTSNGVWAVFTSLNSCPSEGNLLMSMDNAISYSGIGTTLFNNGYHTIFFCPHDANFDNMGGMMSLNGFGKIVSEGEFLNKDFNVWGSNDHTLFTHSFKDLKELGRKGEPFLAAYMTISNHGPYVLPNPLPKGFHPKNEDPHYKAVEYADWSIKYFFDNIKNEDWFNNTIFVFVADHGKNIVPNYEINYYYKHIPMFFYAPGIINQNADAKYQPREIASLGTQMDLFPTLMELLGINYVNNTIGVNLFREKRQAAYYSQHSTIGAVNDSMYLVRRSDGNKQLFKYKDKFSTKDYSTTYPDLAKELEKYAMSNIQTSLWLIKSKKGKYIPFKK